MVIKGMLLLLSRTSPGVKATVSGRDVADETLAATMAHVALSPISSLDCVPECPGARNCCTGTLPGTRPSDPMAG